MKDKFSRVREYILDKIENKAYPANSKLPASRELCKETGASFAIVQHAVSSLEYDGIVECKPRLGTYVRNNCFERIVKNHLVVFNRFLPWLDGFEPLLEKRLPEIRLCQEFTAGMFELRTTQYLQQHRNEYMDLSEFWKSFNGERDNFFQRPFVGFSNPDGTLFGIPFIFSPRVMFYNKTILKKANLPEPAPTWTLDDLWDYMTRLKKHVPPCTIINYSDDPHFWLSFIFRAGGRFFDENNEVCFDSAPVIKSLEILRQLRSLLELPPPQPGDLPKYNPTLEDYAFMIDAREIVCRMKHNHFNDYGTVSIPHFPDGCLSMAQATDLLCIRKECADNKLAAKYIEFMLSEEVQDFIGSECYGIPIRKSSALKSINSEDPRDIIFLTEMNYMSTAFNFSTVEIGQAAQLGIAQIIRGTAPIAQSVKDLAFAIKTIMDIQKNEIKK